jgi:hypothetical protein
VRGTRGEQGFRVACDEPANDSAHAGALAGQNGRFPPAINVLKKMPNHLIFKHSAKNTSRELIRVHAI